MPAANKFSIVKFTDVTEPGQNPYKVVPTFWLKSENSEYVTVPYPSEDELPLAFDRILNCQPPMVEWQEYHAIIEREAEMYLSGILYVKRQSSAPMDEETLMIWKQISSECIKKMLVHRRIQVSHVSEVWHPLRESRKDKQSTRTFKFGKILTKLGGSTPKSSVESVPMCDFKCYDHDSDDFYYLKTHREWLPRPTSVQQFSYGTSCELTGSKKSDLEICELFQFKGPDASDNEEEKESCDVASCLYGLEAEQTRESQSPIPVSTDNEQEKMADSKPSSQSEKTRGSKQNVALKLFNRMTSPKKLFKEPNDLSSPNLEKQGSLKDKSSKTTNVKISYTPIAQPESSRDSYYATTRNSFETSFDVSPDQSLLAKQHSLLRRLHSTLNEATNIVGDFLLLYKRDE